MGLFSKKPKRDVEVTAELAAMAERLAASERAKADLEARLRVLDDFNNNLTTRITTLDEANAQLDARLGALDAGVTTMGSQLTALSESNAQVNRRLAAIDDLDAQVRELTDRVETSTPAPGSATAAPPPPPGSPMPPPPDDDVEPTEATPPPPPPPSLTTPPPPPVGDADEIASQLADLSAAVALHNEQLAAAQQRLDEIDELTALLDGADDSGTDDLTRLREQLAAVDEQLSSMDGRVTSVSTELANQLTELSRDIDELNRRSPESGDDNGSESDTAEVEARLAERLDAAIDEVMSTTERLATEQARYEIQFRSDLAELAERLRRPGNA